MTKGTIILSINENNECCIDNVVSYQAPKNKTLHTDLSKAMVKGYKFSHKETKDGIEGFIYNKIK